VSPRSSIFWYIMPCSPLKVDQSFGGTCGPQFQGQRISQVRNQSESRWQAKELCITKGFHQILNYYVGYKVLTEVLMKVCIFWNIRLCSPLKVNRHWNRPWLPQKSWLTFNGLHGIISLKRELYITATVRISNPLWACWFSR
jgi:hypothetical protein